MIDETLKSRKIACLDLIQHLAKDLRVDLRDSEYQPGLISSDGMSTFCDALEVLAKHGRFVITSCYGRQVSGYMVDRKFELIDFDAAVNNGSLTLSMLSAPTAAEESNFQLDDDFKEILAVLQDYVGHWFGFSPESAREPRLTTSGCQWLQIQVVEILASYRLFRIVRRT